MDARGAALGCWSWMRLPHWENTLVRAASQSCCLTAGQTLQTKSKQSSPGKPALNFEYFGVWFSVSNKESALTVNLYYEWDVHRDTTAVRLEPFCFALPFCFTLVVFNPVLKNGAGRGRENCLPFSEVQNIERAEIFQVVCLLPVHHAFFFPLTV